MLIYFLILSLLLVAGGAEFYFCAQDKRDLLTKILEGVDHLNEHQQKMQDQESATIKKLERRGTICFVTALLVFVATFVFSV